MIARGNFDSLHEHLEAMAVDECVYDDGDVDALWMAVDVVRLARNVAARSRSRASDMEALRGAVQRYDRGRR